MRVTRQKSVWLAAMDSQELPYSAPPVEQHIGNGPPARPMRGFVVELLGYGAASAVALAADVLILKTLVEAVHWHYVPASAVAFVTGAGVAYALSKRFVFRHRKPDNMALEFCYFMALGAGGLLVNTGVLSVGISVLGLGLVTSKAMAAVGTFTTNFILRRKLLSAA